MEKQLELYSGSAGLCPADAAGQAENSPAVKCEDEIRKLVKNHGISYNTAFELKIEANVLKLAYTNNKLLSLSNSRTRILAHQVESTHRVVNSLNQRFLMADEVGLGKTIEAGLVIKEFVFRYGYKRILIVCPASLVMQWQNELQSKFNESFAIMDRHALKRLRKTAGESSNPWLVHDKLICSLDFIKSVSHKEELAKTGWDVIVIDEAHRLRRDDLKTTLAYNVAEILADTTRSFLLLTATPFRGKLEELYYLIYLIDRNLLGPFQTFYNTYCLGDCDLTSLRQRLSSVIIRRTKKEIGGFTSRHAKTIRFEFFPEERILYDATTNYVIEEYNRAMQTENRAIGFVMTVFQKLLDSSTQALLSALVKRKAHLSYLADHNNEEIMRNKLIEKRVPEFNDIDDPEDVDEISDTIQKTLNEIKEEIVILDNLIRLAQSVTRNKKGEKLREMILKLKKGKCKKVLIFTQFRTTQAYLKDILADFKVEIFNGSMDKEKKEEAILNFKEKADILISTEAGGEGRNLQFCNVLINYDLPWSPLKIEQRIGRIHRFGQPDDVYIYNFSTKDTVAERILAVLTKKLKLFEESIGTPDILLGQIEEELNLSSIFMKMAAGRAGTRKVYSEIDSKLKAARESYEKLNELAIAQRMDFNYDEYYKITLQEREYSNKRIETFINTLRENACVDKYLGRKGRLSRCYPVKELPDGTKPIKKQGTFDSDRALDNENLEFLAFGNPIIDRLVNLCLENDFGGYTGIKAIRYKKKLSGMIFFYIINFNSVSSQQEIIPVFIPAGKTLDDEEIREVEIKSLEFQPGMRFKSENYRMEIARIVKNADACFISAGERIIRKADERSREISDSLNGSVEPEIEKITDSFCKKIKEYEEQLERQVCQMKWYNKDMRSAITRTKNKISREMILKEDTLERYRNYLQVGYSIKMLSAGILIAE
ncbi:MAG: DEAD/DEAH box helicase family protein [Spirochaetes bacterium]|nr:DEAD/DEAH box helicase family protein [Spirochaetota bacterium]